MNIYCNINKYFNLNVNHDHCLRSPYCVIPASLIAENTSLKEKYYSYVFCNYYWSNVNL